MATVRGDTIIYGIVGCPVENSLSPAIHNNAFQHFKLNSLYIPLPVNLENQNNIIAALQTLGIQGVNITIPYKESIIKELDHIDGYALKINSVNCLVKNQLGWSGFSTDGLGFIQALEQLKIDIKNCNFLLLGAGGAAKAIAFALQESGAKSLLIKNRSIQKAQMLVDNLNQYSKGASLFQSQKNIDVLVNATSIGNDGKSLPVDKDIISSARIVIDIIYSPELTPILRLAKKQGKIIQNGIPMLVYQARESFKIWTGREFPTTIVSNIFRKGLL